MPEDKTTAKKPEDSKAKGKKKDEKKVEELSEEDQRLKSELELLVVRAQDVEAGVQKLALETLKKEIKSSTSSMTSIPKPLKFLRPHFQTLKTAFTTINADNKVLLADILSVLAMTMAAEGSRESLQFKLLGAKSDISSWGHEYVRNLSGEIGEEFQKRVAEDQPIDELMNLVGEIVPFQMKHNAEHEACDLLMEVDRLELVVDYVDENNYSRVCNYLNSAAQYVSEPEDSEILRISLKIYKKLGKYTDALRVAIRLGNPDTLQDCYDCCQDPSVKKQLGFLLARHLVPVLEKDSDLANIIGNAKLSEYFMELARDLEVTEAKLPEDIYKSHLVETRGAASGNADSARQNLASTFVNGFVNAGFGQDKLMADDGKWIYKNKEHGMMSAAASLGLLLLWDVDVGLSKVDKWLYVKEDYVQAGAALAIGIINSGIKNECDPALGLLTEYVDRPQPIIRIGAILGLGLAYIGSARSELYDTLSVVIDDGVKSGVEVVAMASLALGMIFVGTCHAQVASTIMPYLLLNESALSTSPHARFIALGLGLLYFGKQQLADTTLEALKAIKGPIGQLCSFTVEACAYAGTGNVLKVQHFLHTCVERLEKDNAHQSVAVLGIAMVAMSEELGSEMATRSFDHLLQYGEVTIKRAVPLAIGLLYTSNPVMSAVDTLSKLSHDADDEVSLSAIFALGIIAAGTNNARVSNMLRQLSGYYNKNNNHLFVVRIAQGLVHMGKGTMTLNPFHSDRWLLSPSAMAGLLTAIFSCLDVKNLILSKSHYMLYSLVSAMNPRMLMTLDEDLKPLPVSVRVGQAVDTVGQAGKPKTITGFQTHTTPVLLSFGERAELVNANQYNPLSPFLEGLVILKKNPNYKEEKK